MKEERWNETEQSKNKDYGQNIWKMEDFNILIENTELTLVESYLGQLLTTDTHITREQGR